MIWFKRIFLFFLVNFLVMVTLSVLLNILGVQPYLSRRGIDYRQLAAFCLIWGMGGAVISLLLSRGMAKWMMGVELIDATNATGESKKLLDRVYLLSERAGLSKMPEVGIYPGEEINAFATGPTKNRSLVAVSRGLLRSMNSDQIEGVLGHEIAHIKNGDMVTMTLIQGIVNAFVLFLSRVIAFVISQNVREESRATVRFFTTFLLDMLLSFLGFLVVAAFSRWREFRADRGGADLAGRGKMISALQALKRNFHEEERSDEHEADEQPVFATLKISGRPGTLLALLSTHPPLELRIRRLEESV